MDKMYVMLFYGFRALVRWVPFGVLKPLLYALADGVRWVNKKHRRIIRIHLDLAYGQSMDAAEKERILKACYRNLALNGVDFIRNQNSTKEEILTKVTFVNEGILDEALAQGRTLVFQTAHYGNWELVSLALAAKYGPLSGIGRPLDSPAMNEIVRSNREQLDIELIDKRGAMRPMLKAAKAGRNLGLLVDQSTGAREGVLVDFFGKKVRHTPAASIVARRVDGLIVPVFMTTTDHQHFTLTFYPPIEVAKTEDMEKDILKATQAQARVTEEAIRAKPDEWFWFHRRWKCEHAHAYM
jgi:KDO2-lipid IV(A) lauroyltransferase